MSCRLSVTTLLLSVIVLMSACGNTITTTQPAATASPDPAPINDLRSRFQTAYNAGDAAAVAALYTDDAVSLPDHHAAIQGKVAIQQYFQEVFAQYTTNITLMSPDLEITGDVAHEYGTYTMTLTPKAGGNATTGNGKYLVVLKRQADGSWKLHHDMDNAAGPHPGMAMPGMPMPGAGRR